MHLPGEAFSSVALLSCAILLQAVSGIPLLFARGSGTAQRSAAGLMIAGSLAGFLGACSSLVGRVSATYTLPLGLPLGATELGIDPLSAFFLLPVFLICGCAALYSIGYRPAQKHPHGTGKMTFFTGILAAALTALLMARDGVLFLIAWEIMAVAAYFALTTQDEKKEVREAGILYLITTHCATLFLFALFSFLKVATGSFAFPANASLSAYGALGWSIFFCALLGFGLKAGVMPLHVWLPSAHATAPSHVSAILSGVVLKMGIYGMVRVFSFFVNIPIWWGSIVLALGAISAVVGVAFAIGQHDLKRLLAYHSIENIGIIMLGIGVALVGKTADAPALMALGMGGALLHTLNHATFKGLLFLGAGSVIHATGTREMELMGGVARRLPWTALTFLVGAVAICGLPPLNGFVSELLVYLGFFTATRSLDGVAAALPALAAPALALVGGLALACFVKVYGAVFLGVPRAEAHAGGHEAPVTMLVPMGILAALCALIGIVPVVLVVPLESALETFAPSVAGVALAEVAPFSLVSVMAVALVGGALLLWWSLRRGGAKLPQGAAGTWGCGYLRPTSRMQYTPSSFGSMLVHWFSGALRPETHEAKVAGLFPQPASFESHVPETMLERVYLPALAWLYRKSAVIRQLQHGRLHLYIGYTFVTLVLLMVLTVR
ncbi:hydrogenase [Geomonas sp. RF6]|uniref:proton-conducting transporter transmembrane domain-containing protein n=1 Tax=Geomonas sp. RF6 TaxID=2897342 RepID=UPI001E5CE686|nr:proton-conducting transporter membrane subunit [Geomonas sp. RF6]UFS68788.1 hydrogenase [Geomonas sp. RF6]